MNRPPRAAYVHVPFCRHRCGYCNFTLVAQRDDLVEAYLRAIELELQQLGEPQPVETLFFGGGTPTHLSLDQLGRLLQIARRWFPWQDGAEVSIEANPIDVDIPKAELLASHGVNRISLGVQSWNSHKLATLERDHRAEEIDRAVAVARDHFRSVSVDLIFGAPGETLSQWQDDLQRACRAPLDHLSTYGLTFERGTSFWSRRARALLVPATEELERQMYELVLDLLGAAGWEHYEVSNFARPGHRCRHNEVYWSGEEYFAAGPGAARYVQGRREVNHRSTTTYLKRILAGDSPVAEWECLSAEERARERLVFGLRRLDGIEETAFQTQTGYSLDQLAASHLEQFCHLGFLQRSANRLQLTRAGLLISDAIWPYLLQPNSP